MPPLLLFVSGIIASFAHTADYDPREVIVYSLMFTIAYTVVTFIIASTIAFAWYLIRETWRKRELRRIGQRFGWTPHPAPQFRETKA